ncbi:cell division cycle-associated protein 7-like [Chanos chanos]|uniref:Cell division cycle-associated protein 7-like n=1 Tax=Chanos chanos TaxID=29144 RepID=A0A6J2VM80_CHACN|nr:cell division cycle-associated protein 7-like [Chanos chanos]
MIVGTKLFERTVNNTLMLQCGNQTVLLKRRMTLEFPTVTPTAPATATDGALGMLSLSKGLAEVFCEESENDQTFYGFSDDEINEFCNISDTQPDADVKVSPQVSIKKSGPSRFTLRVSLRSRKHHIASDDDDDDDDYEDEEKENIEVTKGKKKPVRAKSGNVVFKVEANTARSETPSSPPVSGSDTEGESFLAKRAMNIKANKAMLAQLMADLQKMPGALLKKTEGKPKKEPRTGRTPRPSTAAESRRNPERTSRRQTRSMGGTMDDSSNLKDQEELELTLEDELMQVRGAPRHRPAPRSGKPHVFRPVEDITEDELQLVASNMTEKIYNRVTGTTCHQCRQKTVDTKTCCRSEDCRGIQGQFCGPCLRNRYGEDVKTALLDPEWRCPPCRGICNCSFCRQRDGRCPTGILFPLAQYHGFSDVHSYLTSLRSKLKTGDEEDI